MLPDAPEGMSHGVTTVFRIDIPEASVKLTLDESSDAVEWRQPAAWLAEDLHPFVRRVVGLASC